MILLDEPSAGLAPQLVADVTTRLAELNRTTGVSMFIVEQNVRHALRIAHRAYVLRRGIVVGEYSPDTTLDTIQHAFIG
jgi:branched-chain amino acid transport system ATP-binding protein